MRMAGGFDTTMGIAGPLFVWGYPGGTTSKLGQGLNFLLHTRPHRVFIQCGGGDDLVRPVNGRQVADRLLALAARIRGGPCVYREPAAPGEYPVQEGGQQPATIQSPLMAQRWRRRFRRSVIRRKGCVFGSILA